MDIMNDPLVVGTIQLVAITGVVLTAIWFCYEIYNVCRQILWNWLDDAPQLLQRSQVLQVLLQRIGQEKCR